MQWTNMIGALRGCRKDRMLLAATRPRKGVRPADSSTSDGLSTGCEGKYEVKQVFNYQIGGPNVSSRTLITDGCRSSKKAPFLDPKYPKSNPYCQKNVKENRQRLRTEAVVYKQLNNAPYVPCCFTLEHLENGSIEEYIRRLTEVTESNQVINHVPTKVRRRWAVQAARALTALHAAEVIHCDVTPRNFLLNAQLDLHIADFAGCSISGSAPLIAPGPRYQPTGWNWKRKAIEEDDVFALGSVSYFIMIGIEPYRDLEEEEVHLFQRAKFPNVDQLACGTIIQGCWGGTLSTAERVVDALNGLEWEADIA